MMIEPLYWLSWAIFFVAALAILSGGVIEFKQGKNKGFYITFSGFIGLALSGLMMTIACGIP
ncbi:MAG: hypothetical protein IBV52_08675 [Candidatus Bathyarchaeota archaeon]